MITSGQPQPAVIRRTKRVDAQTFAVTTRLPLDMDHMECLCGVNRFTEPALDLGPGITLRQILSKETIGGIRSMVFDHTHSLDVIPRGRLMTKKALIHFGVRLSRDRRRHHRKVHHVVARRRLMTLRALGRARRRMDKLGDGPLGGRMALHAVDTEETLVTVLGRMAAGAVEHRLVGAPTRMVDR